MFTITAVIRAKAGHEGAVERALRAVLAHVKANEPGTIAYVVSQDSSDPRVFTTFERFADEAAMTL
jgi:quinol monooxygenase YgiN